MNTQEAVLIRLTPKICEAGCGLTFLRPADSTDKLCPACTRQLEHQSQRSLEELRAIWDSSSDFRVKSNHLLGPDFPGHNWRGKKSRKQHRKSKLTTVTANRNGGKL